MPTGFRFNPTDAELIEILERKVSGQEMPVHDAFIIERNVYELDPQDLLCLLALLLSSFDPFSFIRLSFSFFLFFSLLKI